MSVLIYSYYRILVLFLVLYKMAIFSYCYKKYLFFLICLVLFESAMFLLVASSVC